MALVLGPGPSLFSTHTAGSAALSGTKPYDGANTTQAAGYAGAADGTQQTNAPRETQPTTPSAATTTEPDASKPKLAGLLGGFTEQQAAVEAQLAVRRRDAPAGLEAIAAADDIVDQGAVDRNLTDAAERAYALQAALDRLLDGRGPETAVKDAVEPAEAPGNAGPSLADLGERAAARADDVFGAA